MHRAHIAGDAYYVSCTCGFSSGSAPSWNEMVGRWEAHLPEKPVRATTILRTRDSELASSVAVAA